MRCTLLFLLQHNANLCSANPLIGNFLCLLAFVVIPMGYGRPPSQQHASFPYPRVGVAELLACFVFRILFLCYMLLPISSAAGWSVACMPRLGRSHGVFGWALRQIFLIWCQKFLAFATR